MAIANPVGTALAAGELSLSARLPPHHGPPPDLVPKKAESLFVENLKPFSTASVILVVSAISAGCLLYPQLRT